MLRAHCAAVDLIPSIRDVVSHVVEKDLVGGVCMGGIVKRLLEGVHKGKHCYSKEEY